MLAPMHQMASVQMSKMLRNLDTWLEKAVGFAEDKSFEVENLLTARLAPDQYHLRRQVQVACDSAKLATVRLTGREAAVHEDGDQTMAELRERIAQVIGFLEGSSESDFDGSPERTIELPFLDGKVMSGRDYLIEFVQPNFYFHVNHAYAILRHNGVELGKRDVIGSLNLRDP